jgi:hypothetical protein
MTVGVLLIDSYVLGSTFQVPSNGLPAVKARTGSIRMARNGLLIVVLLLFACCDIGSGLLESDSYGIRTIFKNVFSLKLEPAFANLVCELIMAEPPANYEEALNVDNLCTARKSIRKAGLNLTKLNILDQRRSIRERGLKLLCFNAFGSAIHRKQREPPL